MTDRSTWVAAVVLILLLAALALAEGPQLTSPLPTEVAQTQLRPGRPAYLVRSAVSDEAHLCAETRDGIACRTVREFRQWVKQWEGK